MGVGWKAIHRWLGLSAGCLALVLGLSGAILAFDPLRSAWQAPAVDADLPVATLLARLGDSMPGLQEIRRLPSGAVVVFAFDGEQARALLVQPADGRVLGPWQRSLLPRWIKQLHRSLLLGDGGRWLAAATALAMGLLCVSGLVLLLARMGGWRALAARVRGSLAQRLHVIAGRLLLAVLLLSALTALTMSASTLGLVALDAAVEPDVVSTPAAPGQAAMPAAQLPLLQTLKLGELRSLGFPDPADPEDTWTLSTDRGQGWIDRYSGRTLAWQAHGPAQQINAWALLLHTGDGAWPWAVVLALAGASVLLFWGTGLVIWWQARRRMPRIGANSPLAQADVLLFVASEGGSTWGFAQTLHAALVQAGHRVHTAALEQFRTSAATRQVFVLAATHGDGQAPAHAGSALARLAGLPLAAPPVPVTVLGFGDRQYRAFCGFAEQLDQTLRARGWPALLPLERIHRQSAQEFARWGEALARALGEPLRLDHVPTRPATTPLTLTAREGFAARGARAAATLRFAWPAAGLGQRLRGRGLGPFQAGDLLGVLPPGSPVPRLYSLASGRADGFVEICVRHQPGGLCSGHLLGLQPGDRIQAFVRANPGFGLPPGRRPVLLVGAGTGVAPLAGFIRGNRRRRPMHLYFGSRDPARDHFFGSELAQWQQDGRLASLHTVFSRVPGGGGHVQDALQRDAAALRALFAQGAWVRVCGSRAMADAVAATLDQVLAPLGQSVHTLRAQDRYADDVF